MDSRARCWLCQSSEHQTDHGEANEGGDGSGVAFEVAGQSAVTTDPCEGSFHDPSFWQNDEAMEIRSFDDIDFPTSRACNDLRHFRSLISGIGENALDKREPAARILQQGERAVAVLDIGGQNAHAEQEAERIDEDMALAARDLLARVEPLRVNCGAPF